MDEKKSNFYLSAGIGTTLSSVQDGIFRGTSTLVLTGKNHEQKMVLQAKAGTALSFNKGSSKQDYPSSMMGSIALIRQTYYDINWYAKNKAYSIDFRHMQYLFRAKIIFGLLFGFCLSGIAQNTSRSINYYGFKK